MGGGGGGDGLLLRWPRLNPLILFAASGVLFGIAASLGR